MNGIVPSARPQLTNMDARTLIVKHGIKEEVVLVGLRGYYSNTFAPAGNNWGVYDDALALVSPTAFLAVNANTDPSRKKAGVAQLQTGVHLYKKGLHGISRKPPYVPYPALRPASPDESVPVLRDGKASRGVAINIHKGGYNTTSSLGCQTIYPDQWKQFQVLVYAEMDRYGQKTIPYLLVDQTG